MKRILGIIFVLGAMMMCLTSCGGNDFDGKWSCVEAEVDTYGGALSGAYNNIEEFDTVSMLCQVEIDGKDVYYCENLNEYEVTHVKRRRRTIILTLKGSYGIESTAELKYDDDDDTITVYHNNNEYTLERSDFLHKVVLGIPWWAYLIFVAAIAFVIAGKRLAAKNAKGNQNRPNFNDPNGNIPQFAPREIPQQNAQQPNAQQPDTNAPTDPDMNK